MQIDDIGVNTHFGYSNTPYVQRYDEVVQKLKELGIRHIRDGGAILHTGQSGKDYSYMDKIMARLNGQPCKILWSLQPKETYDLTVNGPYKYSKNFAAIDLEYILDRLGSKVEALEGLNEPDLKLSSNPNWDSYTRALQTVANRDKGKLPLLSAPLGRPYAADSYAKLGFDFWNLADIASAHFYSGNVPPRSSALFANRTLLRRYALDMPVWVTECGYDTGKVYSSVTEAQQAAYLLQTIILHKSLGIQRTYIYELIDEAPGTGRENNLGLLRYDLTEKPAFTLLKNILNNLEQ